jgi:hypothetical protein
MNRQRNTSKRGKRLRSIELDVERLFMTILGEPGRLDPAGNWSGSGTPRLAVELGAHLGPSMGIGVAVRAA